MHGKNTKQGKHTWTFSQHSLSSHSLVAHRSPEWFLFVFPWAQVNLNILRQGDQQHNWKFLNKQLVLSLSSVLPDSERDLHHLCSSVCICNVHELLTTTVYISRHRFTEKTSLTQPGGGYSLQKWQSCGQWLPGHLSELQVHPPFILKTSEYKTSKIHFLEKRNC